MDTELITEPENKFNKRLAVFLAGCLAGIVFFIFAFGYKIIFVNNCDWLVNNGTDLSQHYLGWKYYRASGWHFPIGMIDNLVKGQRICITYMDSIPLFAVFFKAISGLLPNNFQYFGLYGVLTYALQGGLGALIVYELSASMIGSIIGSGLFLLIPVMLFRTYVHSALAFHPVILMGWLLLLKKDKYIGTGRDILLWILILGLASMIHMYFVPMVWGIMVLFYMKYICSRNWWKGILSVLIPSLFTFGIMYVLGNFEGGVSLATGSFYNGNLNSLFNDAGTSYFDELLLERSTSIYEDFAYLGKGIILLGVLYCFDLLFNHKSLKWHLSLEFVIGGFVFILVSILPEVYLGEQLLFSVPANGVLMQLLAIFRANARFVWPVIYLILMAGIRNVFQNHKNRANLFLAMCLIVQFIDLYPYILKKHKEINKMKSAPACLSDPVWDALTDKKEIFFMENLISGKAEELLCTFSLGNYAADHQMAMNDFYVARLDSAAIQEEKDAEKQNIIQNRIDEDRIYIFYQEPVELLVKNPSFHVYEHDGIYIGLKEKRAGDKEMRAEEGMALGIDCIDYFKEYRDEDEEWKKQGCLLPAANEQRTVPFRLPAGKYRLVVTGEGLDHMQLFLYDEGDTNTNAKAVTAEVSDGRAEYDITIGADEYLALRFRNEARVFSLLMDAKLYLVTESAP